MIVVANKMDMPHAEENLARFNAKYGKKYTVIPMTTIIHEGAEQLLETLVNTLENLPESQPMEYTPFVLDKPEEETYEIQILDDGVFEVVGGLVEILSRKVNMDDYDSFRYFQRVLNDKGVIKALRQNGAKDGDTVIVGDVEFDFVE